MLSTWRADFGATSIELWPISWYGSEANAQAFADSTTPDSASACLVDNSSWTFYFAYHPSKDDLWVVDKTGTVVLSLNLIAQPVTSSAGATLLDTAVRAALAR